MDAFVGVLLVVVVLGGLSLWLGGWRKPWDKSMLRPPGGRDDRSDQ